MISTTTIQQETITDDDLTPYQGMWVGIRDRRVVAVALDPAYLSDYTSLFLYLVPHIAGAIL